MTSTPHADVPHWSWIVPLLSIGLITLTFAGVFPSSSPIVLGIAAVGLAASVFASVHHAEILALRVGEPAGSLILAAAVTIIEVSLIVSIMISGAEGSEVVARDTVFSAIMIVLNGVIGLCLVLGGRRHHEQTFQLNAASAALAVLGTLATLVLVLPNFVVAGALRQFSPMQLIVVSAVSLCLYAVFVFVQTIRHRDYFMEAAPAVPQSAPLESAAPLRPSAHVTLLSGILLPISLVAVILLAKLLSHPLDSAVEAVGLPQAVVGVIIASIVLLPEGIASVRAALLNRLQNSVNLVLGSALASIGMTIPVVALVAIFGKRDLTLGLVPEHMILLLLTLFVSTITLGTGRTTVLQGAVHLGIFTVFLLVSAVP
jgi:Ca2+:H+ antiporter